MVCGTPLEYLQAAEEMTCSACGIRWQGHIRCPAGHALCDACHGREARRIIEGIVLGETDQDPLAVAERMLSHPAVPMLSCDHAYIAAGALLAALRNTPYGSKLGEREVREVFDRTGKQAHGGYCGLTGVCGVVPAVGAVLSVLLGARCGSDREQQIVMETVSRVSGRLAAITGPSCCKAYVRTAVRETAAVLSERLAILLPLPEGDPACTHADRHPHGCREERCPYYRKPSHDVFAEKKWTPGTVCVS